MTSASDISARSPWSFARTRPGAVAAATCAALIVNLVLWLIGLAADGSFELTDAGTTMAVAPGGVVILTVVPMVIGMGLAVLISRWIPAILRVAQVVGVVAALGTIALTIQADFDGVSTAALALMHVVVATAVIVGLDVVRCGTSVASTRG